MKGVVRLQAVPVSGRVGQGGGKVLARGDSRPQSKRVCVEASFIKRFTYTSNKGNLSFYS